MVTFLLKILQYKRDNVSMWAVLTATVVNCAGILSVCFVCLI